MTWTRFMDMHSGGDLKEPPYEYIYIEAPEEQAVSIFYSWFGHNPKRVSCACCGDDYSISEEATLALGTGFDRGCRHLKTPRDPKTGLFVQPEDPAFEKHYYLEDGEEPPAGFEASDSHSSCREYQSLADYLFRKGVLAIYASDIRADERQTEVPAQGHVWVD